MSRESLFFCFGPPKSGTTFLQRLLTSHPRVSCPSEQHLDYLMGSFRGLVDRYNKAVALTDQRTGAQGAFELSPQFTSSLCREIIVRMAQQSGKGKEVVGLSDNSILANQDSFAELFPDAAFICVFRHPIPRAASAWEHNVRLEKEETNPAHRQLLDSFPDYNDWALQISYDFRTSVSDYRKLKDKVKRVHYVLYEDLLKSPVALAKVFQFLNVDCELELSKRIQASNSLARQRSLSPRPHFFGRASIQFTDSRLRGDTLDRIQRITEESLEYLGYETRLKVAN